MKKNKQILRIIKIFKDWSEIILTKFFKKNTKKLKVLYLFNGSREDAFKKTKTGENPGDGFWGMTRLHRYGIDADYIELESIYPRWFAHFCRTHIPIYFIHIPFFWKIFSYDIVFTSSAFGLQALHTFFSYLGIRKPMWVMHDFSISSLVGSRKTLRQKIFYWMASRSAGIITMSKKEHEKLAELFPRLNNRIACIPFGADPLFFKPSDKQKERIVFSAGFDPDRDWQLLIRACDGLAVPLLIATRPARLECFVPLPSFVLHKQLSIQELARQYACSQVVVLPLNLKTGLNDAMGASTLFEMMMSGCAIVATRTNTIETYVKNEETGLIVPPGDISAMRNAINRLLQDEPLREKLSKNAYAYARTHLVSENLAYDLSVFFKNLSEQKLNLHR